MTADAMSGDRDLCLAAGMDDYISKPISGEVLGQAILRCRGRMTVRDAGEVRSSEAMAPPELSGLCSAVIPERGFPLADRVGTAPQAGTPRRWLRAATWSLRS